MEKFICKTPNQISQSSSTNYKEDMVCTVEKYIVNEKDSWDKFEAIGPTTAAIIAVVVAIWQIFITNKQKKINEKQKELQRCSFVYDCFIKEKQEKIIHLRKLYKNFHLFFMNFVSLFFPVIGVPIKDINQNNARTLLGLYHIKPMKYFGEDYFLIATKYSEDLYEFLEENEVFFKENHLFYINLKRTSEWVSKFFINLQKETLIYNDCLYFLNKINGIEQKKDSDYMPEEQKKLPKIREFIYKSLKDLTLNDGEKYNFFLYFMDSYFKKENPSYTNDNIVNWSKNDEVCFYTYGIFKATFKQFQQEIDAFFDLAYNDIQQTIKK